MRRAKRVWHDEGRGCLPMFPFAMVFDLDEVWLEVRPRTFRCPAFPTGDALRITASSEKLTGYIALFLWNMQAGSGRCERDHQSSNDPRALAAFGAMVSRHLKALRWRRAQCARSGQVPRHSLPEVSGEESLR